MIKIVMTCKNSPILFKKKNTHFLFDIKNIATKLNCRH